MPGPEGNVGAPGKTWEGIYIDDRLVLHILPITQVRSRCPRHRDVVLVSRAEEAYDSTEGLSRAVEKEIWYKEDFIAWGTEVRGRSGKVGSPRLKRSCISGTLSVAIARRYIDRKSLERLLAQCIHPLMHRREFMCIISRAYVFCSALPYGVSVKIPSDVLEELCALAIVLALCEADVRWRVDAELSATDATPSKEGACTASCPPSLARGT